MDRVYAKALAEEIEKQMDLLSYFIYVVLFILLQTNENLTLFQLKTNIKILTKIELSLLKKIIIKSLFVIYNVCLEIKKDTL